MSLPRLLVLTDRRQLPRGRGLAETVGACIAAGLSHVVLRELDLADGPRAELAARLTKLGATLIAAHRKVPGAIGVQLPAGATVPSLGRSCHSPAEVAAAANAGVGYVTLGPVGTSKSKPGYGPPLDRAALGGHPIPVYALGGVDPDNAAEMLDAGAHGVAVMGAVMASSEPQAVVRDLLAVTG
ncbi:MAG: thiamine phosphate synthase [Solirubrobacterales bacterium]|nr:thiamine phosphate synthase [Solirubrobacterales bacterium]